MICTIQFVKKKKILFLLKIHINKTLILYFSPQIYNTFLELRS